MLRKTTGLFVSRLTPDPSVQLAAVLAGLAGAAEAAQSRRCGGAEELPAWQHCSSATQLSAAEFRTAKEKKKTITSGEGHLSFQLCNKSFSLQSFCPHCNQGTQQSSDIFSLTKYIVALNKYAMHSW